MPMPIRREYRALSYAANVISKVPFCLCCGVSAERFCRFWFSFSDGNRAPCFFAFFWAGRFFSLLLSSLCYLCNYHNIILNIAVVVNQNKGKRGVFEYFFFAWAFSLPSVQIKRRKRGEGEVLLRRKKNIFKVFSTFTNKNRC